MGIKSIARNRKAWHNYEILEKLEAGLVLTGTEIKSIRDGSVNFKDSYAVVKDGEMWLMEFNISIYTHGNIWNHDEDRPRKLLLHKREILKFYQKIREKGLTLVPLELYLKDGKAKVSIALAKGKALYDKRSSLKKKDQDRELRRVTKRYM